MRNHFIAVLLCLPVFVLAAVLSAGCSGAQQGPIAADTGRDTQLSGSMVRDNSIIQEPSVEYLGTAIDPVSGRKVEGYLFRHPVNPGLGFAGTDREAAASATCYGFLAKGAKWKHVEDWMLNPANGDGLSESFLLGNEAANIAKWEDAADGVMGNGSSIDILGNGSLTTTTLKLSNTKPDGVNAVFLGGGLSSGTIAVTVIWGIFSGPTANRELTEWDQEYNDPYFTWSSSGEPGKMDFEDISTHELGHSCGMNDLYSSSCKNVTMYGYGANGETKKRTLDVPDITGISTLY
jgi:hypothetical protein